VSYNQSQTVVASSFALCVPFSSSEHILYTAANCVECYVLASVSYQTEVVGHNSCSVFVCILGLDYRTEIVYSVSI